MTTCVIEFNSLFCSSVVEIGKYIFFKVYDVQSKYLRVGLYPNNTPSMSLYCLESILNYN